LSYIGKTPTPAPLTSSDITDSIISLPKLTDGTDGNLISYDASGNPVAIATGNDGQVLTSAGAGATPAFETIAAAAITSTANGADNRVATYSDADSLNGEANMTFTGSALGLGNNTNINMLITNTSNAHYINFGDTDDADAGSIGYDHGGTAMLFGVNAATRFSIDGNGQTVIDVTSGGLKKNVELKNGSSKAGILGCEGTNAVVGTGDIAIKFDNANNIYRPYNADSGSGVDNTGDLGSSSHRFKVVYAGTGSINTSDKRHKNNIADTDLGLDFVNKLKPKKYKLNDGQSNRTHYGLISQDVETLLGEISKSTTDFAGFIKTDISEDNTKDIANIDFILDGNTDEELTAEKITELNAAKTKVQNKNNDIYALRYEEFISPIIKAIQELKTENDSLKTRITTLENA